MDKNFLTQVTSHLYQLTLLFPKKEPLRLKMRETALEILEDSIKLKRGNPSPQGNPEIFKNLEVLDSFFEIANNQNWVGSSDILKLKGEYSILRGELEKLWEKGPEKAEKKEFEQGEGKNKISFRQQKILEVLSGGKKIQVKDLKEIFPEMSKRTLRRDFESLLNQGLIERIGEKQDTFYQIRPIL